MPLLYGDSIMLQAHLGWGLAGIFLVVVVVCCLLMMFMMGRGMSGRSSNQNGTEKQSKKNEGEQPGTKKP